MSRRCFREPFPTVGAFKPPSPSSETQVFPGTTAANPLAFVCPEAVWMELPSEASWQTGSAPTAKVLRPVLDPFRAG
jgi:hypothetical protein